MTSSKRLVAFLLAASIALPAPLFAQSAQELETARELNKEGKELRAQGQLDAALAKFKAAHALGRTPVTGIELARTHVLLGHLVEAREVCLGVSRIAVALDETDRSANARAEAQKLADELKPRIPAIRVKLRGLAVGARATVHVDGDPLPAAMIDEPYKVNPGRHEIVANVEGGPEVKMTVDVRESESHDVPIEIPPIVTLPTAPVEPAPPRPLAPNAPNAARSEPARPRNKLASIGLGVGGMGIAIGALAGLEAMSKASTLSASCPQKQCAPPSYSDLDAAKSWGTFSTIAFGVGAAGVALGVYALIAKKPSSSARVAPAIGLGRGGGTVGVHGAF